MKLSILGYMGTGKSSIGKVLAQKLKLNFIDLDDFITDKEKATVPQIFKNKGEIYFRKIEKTYLNQILDKPNDFVLSLGGGTPIFYDNLKQINLKSISIHLQASPIFLSKRLIHQKEERPLIQHLNQENFTEFIAKHLFERNPFYQQAKYSFNIENKEIDEIVDEIINRIQS